MEILIQKLQTLLDEIKYEGLDISEVTEKVQDIIDDAHNLYDVDGFIDDEAGF